MHKFIHFGCWNEGGVHQDESKNSLTRVMELLNEVCENEPKPDFISIAGDNYYPNVIKDE